MAKTFFVLRTKKGGRAVFATIEYRCGHSMDYPVRLPHSTCVADEGVAPESPPYERCPMCRGDLKTDLVKLATLVRRIRPNGEPPPDDKDDFVDHLLGAKTNG